jgi:hypothetical protein
MIRILFSRFPRYPTFPDNQHLRHLHNHDYSILTIPIVFLRCGLILTYWSSSPPRSLTLILAVSTHMNLSPRVTGTRLWRTYLAASLFPFPELRFLQCLWHHERGQARRLSPAFVTRVRDVREHKGRGNTCRFWFNVCGFVR